MSGRHLAAGLGVLLLALHALPALAQTAAPQPSPPAPAAAEPFARERVLRGAATVQSIDQATRQVVLRAQDGRLSTITAGPEVRNLAQVRVGDRVVVEYRDALLLEMATPGTAAEPQAVTGAGRAEEGQRPGAVAGEALRVRVKIVSVNPADGRVTFEGPRGVRSVVPQDPRVREYVAGLRPGDEVDVTWVEALAVSVHPARGR
jgi:hypothetical protein